VCAVVAYDRIARFYDTVMDDPGPRADRVQRCIERYRPGATTLLELGCGTGSVLARLAEVPSLTGLDRSAAMLAVAREKVPRARLVEGDMSSFALGERFDVVISVFDSINHLVDFEAWCATFELVHAHLLDGGLFVFDVNTMGELRRLGADEAWVFDFEEGVMIMDVSYAEDGVDAGLSEWDIRIFERTAPSTYTLHREQIGELAVRLDRIESVLTERFELLEATTKEDRPATDESVKAYFAYRRAP
jgi:SAM-dependent methyltransferase